MSAASGTLARQYVEFISKGLDELQDDMGDLRAGLDLVDRSGKTMSESLRASFGLMAKYSEESLQAFQKVTAQITKVGESAISSIRGMFQQAGQSVQQAVSPAAIGAAVAAFQLLTDATRSWVQAGMAGTTHGNMLSLQMTMLSQQIAGIFVPTLNMVIHGIEKLVGWFRSLTGEQQSTIRHWLEAAAVMTLVSMTLGRVTSMVSGFVATMIGGVLSTASAIVSTLIPAFGALVTAITTGSGIASAALGVATGGISVILGLIATAIGAMTTLGVVTTGFVVGTRSGRDAMREIVNSIRPAIDAFRELGATIWQVMGPVIEAIGFRLGNMVASAAFGISRIVRELTPFANEIIHIMAEIGQLTVQILEPLGRIALAFQSILSGAGFSLFLAGLEGVAKLLDGIAGALEGIIDILTRIGALNIVQAQGFQRPKGADQRTDVQPAGGRFEGAMDLFRRLNETAVKSNIPEQHLDVARRQLEAELAMLMAMKHVGNEPKKIGVPGVGGIGVMGANGVGAVMNAFGM